MAHSSRGGGRARLPLPGTLPSSHMVTRARPGKCEPRGPTSPLRASAAPPAPSPASGARFLLAASPRLRRPPPRLGPGQLAARGAPRRRSAPEWPPACRLPGHWGPRRNGAVWGRRRKWMHRDPGRTQGPGRKRPDPGLDSHPRPGPRHRCPALRPRGAPPAPRLARGSSPAPPALGFAAPSCCWQPPLPDHARR